MDVKVIVRVGGGSFVSVALTSLLRVNDFVGVGTGVLVGGGVNVFESVMVHSREKVSRVRVSVMVIERAV